MLRTKRFSKELLGSIRQNLGGEDENDTSFDKSINIISRNRLLKAYLTWHGIIGFEDIIKNAIEEIYQVELNEKED